MSNEAIVQRAFAAVDRKLRSASIAEIGGFRPPDDPLTSWFGGRFVAPAATPWPESASGPMIPLLQVRISDLPHVPAALAGMDLVQIFIDNSELPLDLPAPNGSGWTLRAFSGLEALSSQDTPAGADQLRPFPVRWYLSASEGPSWEDAFEDDHGDFMRLPGSEDLFYDRYKNHPGTKVGGWPSWIQSPTGAAGDLVFQIASEEKPRWMAGDNGNLYIFHESGEWSLSWDCY